MAKPIIELRHDQPKQSRSNQIRFKARPELKISVTRQAEMLLQQRKLTLRDLDMVRAFIGVGILTRHQIQRLFFKDQMKTASNRLAKLYYEYYFLERGSYWLTEMYGMGLEPCYIYALSSVGQEAFALHNGLARSEVPYAVGRYSLMRDNHMLLHDLQISEMFTRLQVAVRGRGGRFIWFNEMAATIYEGQEELVRPDGLAWIGAGQSGHKPVGYFIEMDRGNTDWEQKVTYYERARQRGLWHGQFHGLQEYPAVLAVVPSSMYGTVCEVVMRKKPLTPYYVQPWETLIRGVGCGEWYDPQRGESKLLWEDM